MPAVAIPVAPAAPLLSAVRSALLPSAASAPSGLAELSIYDAVVLVSHGEFRFRGFDAVIARQTGGALLPPPLVGVSTCEVILSTGNIRAPSVFALAAAAARGLIERLSADYINARAAAMAAGVERSWTPPLNLQRGILSSSAARPVPLPLPRPARPLPPPKAPQPIRLKTEPLPTPLPLPRAADSDSDSDAPLPLGWLGGVIPPRDQTPAPVHEPAQLRSPVPMSELAPADVPPTVNNAPLNASSHKRFREEDNSSSSGPSLQRPRGTAGSMQIGRANDCEIASGALVATAGLSANATMDTSIVGDWLLCDDSSSDDDNRSDGGVSARTEYAPSSDKDQAAGADVPDAVQGDVTKLSPSAQAAASVAPNSAAESGSGSSIGASACTSAGASMGAGAGAGTGSALPSKCRVRPYRCDVCTASYSRQVDFEHHEAFGQHLPRPFACSACGTTFVREHELHRHCALVAREFLARVDPVKVASQEQLLAHAQEQMEADQLRRRASRAAAAVAAAAGASAGADVPVRDGAGACAGAGASRSGPSAAQLASVDPYVVLGLQPGADPRAVRRRYRELARLLHPDRQHANASTGGDAAAAAATAGEGAFIQLQRAYDRLCEIVA